MKSVLLVHALIALFTTSAFASGADLSVVACPGNAGASSDAGSLDCAGGQRLTLLVTFMPAEDLPDLADIDVIFDLSIGGDVFSDATFWDFAGANPGALSSSAARPAGCENYTDAWGPSGISDQEGIFRTHNSERIAAIAYRDSAGTETGIPVLANQRIFGLSLTIDGSTSVEAGGTMTGCTKSACIVLSNVFPRTRSGGYTTPLTSGSVFGSQVTVNGGQSLLCQAVPTRTRTWGQLKSLYR